MHDVLARSCKKRSFPCKILQDLVRSCGILWDFAGILQESCRNFMQESCKIPAKSHKIHRILQDLARSCRGARKRTFSCKILQERFYWGNRVVAYDIAICKNYSYSVCVVYTHINDGTWLSILCSRRITSGSRKAPLSS